MTEHTVGTTPERLAAHERLSTGALARWARACATHPWRVVLAWIGIIALLFVLVATVGRVEALALGRREDDVQHAALLGRELGLDQVRRPLRIRPRDLELIP